MNKEIEMGGSGAGFSQGQARKMFAEVGRLEKKYGRTPTDEELLEAASDPKSSFHAFVFNKSKDDAARAYYISRVQFIMRHLVAITMSVDGGRAQFRAFVRTPDGYERITEIQPGSATADMVARQLASEISSAHRRAEAWRVLLGPSERVNADEVIAHLNKANTAVREMTKSQEPIGMTA